jgi:uncharacterized membrane protein (UPF0127 family)
MAFSHTAVVKLDDGAQVCDECVVADSFATRLRGLLGRARLPHGEGLLLRPAGSIHTWFMRFPIDAVFLDREMRVMRIASDLGPWRTARRKHARAVLELAAGEAGRRRIEIGDRLAMKEAVR